VTADEFRLELVTQPVPPPPGADPELDEVEAELGRLDPVGSLIAGVLRDTLDQLYDGQHTGRQVEPHRLVLLGRRWYLVGYDLTRQDWRSFRLDRLAGPRGTGARFRPRELPAADAATFVQAGIGAATAVYQVEALVDAPAATVRERYGRWATVEEISETRSRVRMTADQLEWPMMLLGGLGAEFEVISPPELLDGVRDWARRFTQVGLAGERTGT